MRAPDEDPMAELHQQVIEALKRALPLISTDDMVTLLIACGVTPDDIFGKNERKAA
jgi:hypothetical protein